MHDTPQFGGLQMRLHPGRVQLRYPGRWALQLAVMATLGLPILWLSLQLTGLQKLWPVMATLWGLATVWNLCSCLWLSTIEFDRARDRVSQGPRTLGRLSTLWAIEQDQRGATGLRLLFLDRSGDLRHRVLSRVGPSHAHALGMELARVLGVNFG